MLLASPTKPGIKAGRLSIEAVCAEPAREYSGFGEGRTFVINPCAYGMRD
jgi:hypothetical protein